MVAFVPVNAVNSHQVVIAGGGPTGLMLAGELALAGADPVIVERRATQEVEGSRAGGLHSRTLDVLDMRGIVARFLDAGQTVQITGFSGIPLDLSDAPTRYPYTLALRQGEIERLLAEWVDELGVPTLRRAMGGPGPTRRRDARRRVAASRDRRGPGARGGAHPARRPCCLDWVGR